MRIFKLIVLCLLCHPAVADICSGPVDRIQLTRLGNVEVISTSLFGNTDGRVVCNMNGEWKDIAAGTCSGWYSLLLASVAQKTNIRIQYESGIACRDTAAWVNAPAPWMLSNN